MQDTLSTVFEVDAGDRTMFLNANPSHSVIDIKVNNENNNTQFIRRRLLYVSVSLVLLCYDWCKTLRVLSVRNILHHGYVFLSEYKSLTRPLLLGYSMRFLTGLQTHANRVNSTPARGPE